MAKGEQKIKVVNKDGAAGFVFFLAFFGALVYFINRADGFWEVLYAFVQAAVWPAILVYKIFTVLQI